MRVSVLLNEGSGSVGRERCAALQREIRQAFGDAGVQADPIVCAPARLTETARQIATQRLDAIVAAGGDGTVSAIAAGLAGGSVPLAVLPLGTLNHFARDLGMARDVAEAARAIAGGQVARVDVGEVNGRVFINNSSIGLYPEMVTIRDRDRHERKRGKWPAMALAAWRVLRRFRLMRVHVELPDRSLDLTTPFVFVGNNEYSTDLTTLGQRDRLDRGRLGLYTVHTRGRMQTLGVMLRAILGRAEAVREAETELVTSLTVTPHSPRPRVALDGEVFRMIAPLHYRIRPGALPVIVPAAIAAAG